VDPVAPMAQVDPMVIVAPQEPFEKLQQPYSDIEVVNLNKAPDDVYIPYSDQGQRYNKDREPYSQILHFTDKKIVAPPKLNDPILM